MNNALVKVLQARLDYAFQNTELAQAAVTHRSAGGRNNERLEFLGDAVLGLVIAEALYRQLGALAEGDLSRLRASLVNRDTLAELGQELALGELLLLGAGERKSGGFRRKSILADAIEALLGAVYLDGGFTAARDLVLHLFTGRLQSLPDPEQLKDAKTRLQEYLQGRGLAIPVYDMLEVRGKAHEQSFVVRCEIAALDIVTQGTGRSRRLAEQQAAEQGLLAARAKGEAHG